MPTSQWPVWQLGSGVAARPLSPGPLASHPCTAAARTPDSARAPWSLRGRSECGRPGRNTPRRRSPPRPPSRCWDTLRGLTLRRYSRSADRCTPRREVHQFGRAACNPAARWSCTRPPCLPTAQSGNRHRQQAIALPRRWAAHPVSRAAWLSLPSRRAQSGRTPTAVP